MHQALLKGTREDFCFPPTFGILFLLPVVREGGGETPGAGSLAPLLPQWRKTPPSSPGWCFMEQGSPM